MRNKLVVQVIAAIVVTVFAVGIWWTGDVPKLQWLRFFSVAVWLAVAALFAWDKLIWRWGLFQKFKVVPRDIRGTWRGILKSQWTERSTDNPPPPKEVYLVVRQDASSVSVVLLTDESRSASSLAEVVEDRTGATLNYMYLNRPESRVEDRSRMHPGSASLDVIGRPVTRLSGRYWTDRNSRGEFEFTERRLQYAEGFAEAGTLFDKATGTGMVVRDGNKKSLEIGGKDDRERPAV